MSSFKFTLLTVLISFATFIVAEEETVNADSGNATGVDLNEYRFHEETNKYEKLGSTEPCKDNMRFFAIPGDDKNGLCDCDYYECSRPLLYSKVTGACHYGWSQGPCKTDEWYTFDKTLKPICEKNTCPLSPENSTTSEYYFKRPEDGKCYLAGTQGYCKEHEGLLMIYPNKPIPVCRTSTVCNPLSFPPQQVCAPGNRITHDGLCDEEKN